MENGKDIINEHARPGTRLLIDHRPVKLQLVEAGQGGKLLVRGEFARAGIPTENKRVYPKSLIERELSRLSKALKERQMLGELDHPADGRTQLSRVSHLVTGLEVEGDLVVGVAEPLDTDRGKNLKALLQSGAKIGVSSRGYGSIKTNERGEDVVQDDYRLVTFDFVAEPADSNAYPEVVYEEKQRMSDKGSIPKLEDLKTSNPELWAEIEAMISEVKTTTSEEARLALKDEFTKEVIGSVARMKNEMREQVRGEFLADPAVAASRTAIERIKESMRPFMLGEDAEAVVKQKDIELAKLRRDISERDLRERDLKSQITQLEDVAKEAGYKFFLGQLLSEDPDAELIKKLVGDVKTYAKSDDIKARVEAIRADLKVKKDAEAAVAEESKKLQDQVKSLTEGLQKSLAANKELLARVYMEQKLIGNPEAAKVRSLSEVKRPTSTEDVDAIIESLQTRAPDADELENVRSRVRTLTKGGSDGSKLEEGAPRPGKAEQDFQGLGASVSDLRALSGIR